MANNKTWPWFKSDWRSNIPLLANYYEYFKVNSAHKRYMGELD
jgi:hypothetical protein